jgi:hypothetical protein
MCSWNVCQACCLQQLPALCGVCSLETSRSAVYVLFALPCYEQRVFWQMLKGWETKPVAVTKQHTWYAAAGCWQQDLLSRVMSGETLPDVAGP